MEDTTTTQAAPEAATPPVQVPQADPNAVMNEIARRAAQMNAMSEEQIAAVADQRLQARLKTLLGEPEKPKVNPELVRLAQDPKAYADEIKREAVEAAKKDINDAAAYKAMVQSVSAPLLREYPELDSPRKLAFVETLAMQHSRAGLSDAEAIKKGFEDAATELGLTKQSERAKERTFQRVGLPVGGAYFPSKTPSFDAVQSAQSFQTGMLSKSKARRGR